MTSVSLRNKTVGQRTQLSCSAVASAVSWVPKGFFCDTTTTTKLEGQRRALDFGDRAEKHNRGIEIRRGLRLVDLGMGIRDNDCIL